MENREQAIAITEKQIRHIREVNQLADLVSLKGEDGVLLTLKASPGRILSGEIMERTGLTTGRVANILKNLESKHQIDRIQDQGDRRRIYVRLTRAGEQAAAEVYDRCVRNQMELLEKLSGEESEELLCLLSRAIEVL